MNKENQETFEFLKNNKEWRQSHLYRIIDKSRQLITYLPNRAQKHFQKNKHTRNILLKSRQLGFTTEGCVDMLDSALWIPNFNGLFIAQDLDTARDLFSNKIELAWKNYEGQDQYICDTQSARQLKFDFGNGMVSSIVVDSSGRSGTFNKVHVTEFALVAKNYPDKAQEIIEGTIHAVPIGGEVTIESTAEGAGGMFYDMFMEAWNRSMAPSEKEYKAHFYNWQWDDEGLAKTIIQEVPEEFKEYQKKINLSDREISYYYQCFLSLNKSWNALKRQYPTTPEEAFEAIIEGVIFANEILYAKEKGHIGEVEYDPDLLVHTVWDLGKGPNIVVGFLQKTETSIRMIDEIEGVIGDAMPQIIKKVKDKPYIYGKHFGPHDIYDGEIATGIRRIDTARNLNFNFVGDENNHGIPDVSIENGIDKARTMWPHFYINEKKCPQFLKAIFAYQYEWDEKRGMWKNNPYHNWASHWGDFLRYTALVEDKMDLDMQFDSTPYRPTYLRRK